jgi:hypothetical protein
MSYRDVATQCSGAAHTTADQPKIIRIGDRDYEIIFSFSCPPIPAELLDDHGRLDPKHFSIIGTATDMGVEQGGEVFC